MLNQNKFEENRHASKEQVSHLPEQAGIKPKELLDHPLQIHAGSIRAF
jgi:hypothetical protein